jgi:hypothetical protein
MLIGGDDKRFVLYGERPNRKGISKTAQWLKGKSLLRWLSGHKVRVWVLGTRRWTVVIVKDDAPNEKPTMTAHEAMSQVAGEMAAERPDPMKKTSGTV